MCVAVATKAKFKLPFVIRAAKAETLTTATANSSNNGNNNDNRARYAAFSLISTQPDDDNDDDGHDDGDYDAAAAAEVAPWLCSGVLLCSQVMHIAFTCSQASPAAWQPVWHALMHATPTS